MSSKMNSRQGFALILALSLMGFLVLLLLGVTAFLRSGIKQNSDFLLKQLAKENAKVGLRLALGNLQYHLGPDQRVTTLSDDASGGKVPVVEVWDGKLGVLEKHLVSGEGVRSAYDVVLYKNEIAQATASKVQMDPSGELIGHYAYWVSDEGLKAKIPSKVNNRDFLDFTNDSLGLVVDVKNGGLKKNLMAYLEKGEGLVDDEPLLDTEYSPKWGVIKSFYHQIGEVDSGAVVPNALSKTIKPSLSGVGDESLDFLKDHALGPIIMECVWGVCPRAKSKESPLEIYSFVEVALKNPYDVSLAQGDYLFDVSIVGSGKPCLSFEIYDAKNLSNSGPLRYYLAAELIDDAEQRVFRGKIKTSFEPGESKIFKLFLKNEPISIENGNILSAEAVQGGSVVYNTKKAFLNAASLARNQDDSRWKIRNVQLKNRKGESSRNKSLSFSLKLTDKNRGIYQEIKQLRLARNGGKKDISINAIQSLPPTEPIMGVCLANKMQLFVNDTNIRAPFMMPHGHKDSIWQEIVGYTYPHWTADWVYADFSIQNTAEGQRLDLPNRARCGSLADFKNLNLTPYGHLSSFCIGNSQKPLFVDLDSTVSSSLPEGALVQDYAYLLNQKLWDRFFIYNSNSRNYLVRRSADSTKLNDFSDTASMVYLDAAFNVNSRSVLAWRKILEPLVLQDRITERQCSLLAKAIVKQVSMRGPFMSLGSFINRSLGTDSQLAQSGAIQAALDECTVDAIDQADVLQVIGDKLTVRSDTFLVRAYGDVADPADKNTILAKAYCEALIQRVPEFIESTGNQPSDEMEELSDLNQNLGRRFKIIGFRWLGEGEL